MPCVVVWYSHTLLVSSFMYVELVSTHVCDRLSAIQKKQARLPEILVQNSFSDPIQVFQECWSGVPLTLTPENENLARSWHFGFELVWSTTLSQMKIWPKGLM